MQLFVWAIYATSIIQVLATPVIGLTVMLVGIEKVGGFGLFDATKGGDPVLFQHMFWFYSHPAVYIMVLPSMGVVSDAIAAFARKNVFGYKMIAYSSLGIAFVGFFAWGHHMFVSGQSPFDNGAFAVISMFVGVFTAIKVFNWVATLYRGAILVSAPFIYICGFLFFIVFGGMTGIAVATVSLDVHWHDTYFVVAHFHFIMVGAVIMGVPDRASTTGSRRCSGASTTRAGAWSPRRSSCSASSPRSSRSSSSATRACRAATTCTRSGSRR